MAPQVIARVLVIARTVSLAVVVVLSSTCCMAAPAASSSGAVRCAFWYAIGATPTDAQLDAAVGRYGVVVLNAWDTAALHRIKERDPATRVLVYKDLSSTRSYAGAVTDGSAADALLLPTGIGYKAAERDHPDWFAVDTSDHRVEWQGYPQHWQMAVWNGAYQKAWTEAVTTEVVRNGWDGVLGDNDFASLSFYSDSILAGTANKQQTDQQIRDGLDGLITTAGTALATAHKLFVPNVSESRLYPGRWTTHSRFGGAMEENFAQEEDGQLLTWQGSEWGELQKAVAAGRLTLLVTAGSPDAIRTGAAAAALLTASNSCWTAASDPDYTRPEWTPEQQLNLGPPTGVAQVNTSGTWIRSFQNGWAGVNPDPLPVNLTAPAGLSAVRGSVGPAGRTMTFTLPGASGTILARNLPL